MKSLLTIAMSSLIFASCCDTFGVGCPKGCTDSKALNYDFSAKNNDGSCRYSKATFYAQFGFYQGVPINQIELKVDGSTIGSIATVYPNGPGNCNATGTVGYQFLNGNPIDWNTTVLLANGLKIFWIRSIVP